MNISEAISSHRIYHQWMPDTTYFEEGVFSNDSKQSYEKMGHKTETHHGVKYGEAMGIHADIENNVIYGAADPRSPDGSAKGY